LPKPQQRSFGKNQST